jgi:hypothetical protein
MATLDQLNDLQASFADTIRRQQAEIDQLRTVLSSSKPRPKPVLPDPEKFNGTVYRWDTWYPQVKAKLRIDAEAISSAEAQFHYVYGNLESKVQALVLPQLHRAERMQAWDPQSILTQLARIYEDPNRTTKAQAKLHSLRQGDDNFATYLAKFERLLYEGDAIDWPNTAKIALLRTGLSVPLKNKLSFQLSLPAEYEKFVHTLHTLGDTPTRLDIGGGKQGHSGATGEPMDISAIRVQCGDDG